MTFSSRPHSLCEQLVDDLGRSIVSGELNPGDLLPAEGELLAHYEVSRPVLREALQMLAAKGLIVARQRRGTMVRPRNEWSQLDGTLLDWHRSLADSGAAMAQLMEVRHIVEPQAAALAAQRAGAEDLAHIAAAYDGMARAEGQVEAFIAADLDFHAAILEAAQNQFLLPVVQAIRTTMAASLHLTNDRPEENRRVSLPLHAAILEAIQARDPVRASEAMRLHLEDTERLHARVRRTRKTAS